MFEHESPGEAEDEMVARWTRDDGMEVTVSKMGRGVTWYDEGAGRMKQDHEYHVTAGDDEGGAGGPELGIVQGVHGSYRGARSAAVEARRVIDREGLDGSDLAV